MSSSEILIKSNQKLKCTDGEKIAKIISMNPHIIYVDLSNNKLADVGIKGLCQALTNNNTLQTLILCNNKISARGAKSLQKVLRNNCTLKRLRLTDNPLGLGGAAAIKVIIDNKRCAINYLDLGGCNFGDLGIEVIAKGLINNTSIKALYLNNNEISKGMKHLAHVLESNNTIQRLELYGNPCYSGSIIHFAEALNNNQSIVSLNLSQMRMDSYDSYCLAKSLRNNSTLQVLNLSYNYIVHGSSLLAALEHNFTLTNLDLYSNNINSKTRADIEDEVQFNGQMADMIKILKEMNIRARNLYVFKHYQITIPYHIKLMICFSEVLCELENLRLTNFFMQRGYLRLTRKLIKHLLKIPSTTVFKVLSL